ncbi:MAG: tripartite tricarboxylate transporter substrate binding protein [Thermodesulfobacteriota bacterium]|nr:tripartite tricarboxylate transporter substrate binding protein [Thermodesulfobacteriota bacterium]
MEAKKALGFTLTLMLVCSLTTMVYAAPTPADVEFYKGKNITYVVATKPGGGYDTYGRLIGKYMQKHISGSTVIVKNVPGAGHIIGANEIYLAKPDGLTLGTFNTGLIYSQIIGQPGIRFDLAKYSWIGKANSEYRILLVGKETRFKTLKDVLESKEPIKIASSGVGSADYNETLILAEATGAKLKTIPGYSGREGEMAIMRGEVDGIIGSYTGLLGFIKAGECRALLQIAGKKHKDLPEVPLSKELNLSEKGIKLISLIVGVNEVGRMTAGPPNIPAGRLAVLRDAYKKALTDPELLKDAEKIGLDFDPGFGEDVAKMVREAIQQPEENVALLKKIIKID